MKRYGRNRRRKHREEIARLNVEVSRRAREERLLRSQVEQLTAVLHEQKEILREVVDAVNAVAPHSAVLPPREIGVSNRREQPMRIKLVSSKTWRRNDLTLPCLGEAELLTVDLWEVRATLEQRAESLDRLVHVLLPDNGHLVYRVSGQAWQQARRGFLPMVAKEVHRAIIAVVVEGP